MAPRPGPGRAGPGGLIGTYALHLMMDQPIHGWRVAERIGEVTHGGWRPGAGAIYPILKSLVTRGLARVEVRQGKKLYVVTPRGRARVREVQRWIRRGAGRWVNLRYLVLELIEPSQRDAWILQQLKNTLDGLAEAASGRSPSISEAASRRLAVRGAAELRKSLRIVERSARRPAPRPRTRARA